MKILISCFLYFTLPTKVFSQNENFKITYRHNIQYDTSQKLRDTIGFEAILIGNNLESNYCFAKKTYQLPKVQKAGDKSFQDIINSKQSGMFFIQTKWLEYDSIGNMLYNNKSEKKLFVREKMENEYVLTEEDMVNIDWIITGEKRNIKNYLCTRATAQFRGRDYTAWFTTDVPIVTAPWKFFGLPGLLMDIEDSKHQVKIYVEKIEYPVNEKVPYFVSIGTKVSMEKYFQFRNEEVKKVLKGMEAIVMQQEHIQDVMAKEKITTPFKSKSAVFNIEIGFE